MKRNLLIVEDDGQIRKMLSLYFENRNYNILEAETGADAIAIFRTEEVNIVFLDLMLPEMDGLKVCEIVRETSDVPIIMLTAKSQEEDKLRGFSYGADEYVTKPFSLKVLEARTEALLKRAEGKVSRRSQIETFDGLVINHENGEVIVDGQQIRLTAKEHDLLFYLVKNKQLILSKSQILDHVWGYDYEGDPRTVDTTIKRLREKMKGQKGLIRTLRGRGYQFMTEETGTRNKL
ncbi:MAG: response regulator transcription factor [Clostridiales bacterium]|nr:response regulator transcription factor [Clostridiales bacterium]